MELKNNILNKLYYNPSGFQSQQRLYKEAKQKYNTITMKDVKEWYSQNVEKTRYYKYNSFVAPHPNYEYQVDLFFISDLKDQKYQIGMACIDIFSRLATVVPIKSKQSADFLAGLMECLTNMKHKPELIYSDNEGSLNSNDVLDYLKSKNIDIITSRNHAHFVERFIRTFKMMLRKRINYDITQGKEIIEWTDYIFPILLTYNNKNVLSTTNATPAEAAKPSNQYDIKANLELNAKTDRKYPDIHLNDKVKIMLKYDKMKKETNPLYSNLKYNVDRITEKHGIKLYMVNHRDRLRNELLKTMF